MTIFDEDITAFDIETNYQLYHNMIDIMTKVDGVAPIGSCCGRNKKQHCETFINNIDKYKEIMAEIAQRTIQPKTNGKLVYVSKENQFYNLDLCGDKDIQHLIDIDAVSKDDFIFPAVTETKAKATKKSK